jgi:hypothetical protein
MFRIRVAAAALLLTLSGSAFAAGPGLPLPVPTLPGVALVQLGDLGGDGLLGLGSLPGLGSAPGLSLPPLPFGPPEGLVLLLGNLTVSMSPFAQTLPLVGLVEAGDPVLRPLITPVSGPVYIPVLGAAFGTN